jgi:hypothetical protein
VFSSPQQWSTGLDSISTSFLHLLIGVSGLLFMLFVNLPGSLRQPCDGTKVAHWATWVGPLRRFVPAHTWGTCTE